MNKNLLKKMEVEPVSDTVYNGEINEFAKKK